MFAGIKILWCKDEPRLKMETNTQAVFSAILKTFKGNKLMVDTRGDGIYIRLAGKPDKGEIFSLDWWKVFSFNEKSNTCSFAERELSILSKSAKEPDNRPIIEPFTSEILALCEKFGQSGQSGGSAPYTAGAICQALKKLLLQEPIMPMTGIDEEWMDVSEYSDGQTMYQNRRCHGLFKDGTKAWYLDAIVWKDQHGHCWSGQAFVKDGPVLHPVLGRQVVKSFPFTPKTFYIDVISEEVAPDDFEFYVKDHRQLKRVFKYYDRYEQSA